VVSVGRGQRQVFEYSCNVKNARFWNHWVGPWFLLYIDFQKIQYLIKNEA